ncbi:hypothetical protein C7974DRAFT_236089 [Boeremia exigua]|uniref:uncharacterized protein n=1 Tax=Boeremia exigua TaxID=749465 RepID=UPI001E8D44F1|nr:uncharacterized protein C7974DRAFT_236089 [Boeremia exigua]KAH6620571.1 hypothetical protein C7974DRAFT_236089 [Boeremia exigua]
MARTKRRKMINLFNGYPGRDSQLVRDRLYSLTSLSSDAESIPVDYAISDHTFFAKVVVALHDTMSCMCSVALAANTLHYAATGGIVKAGEEEHLFKLTAYHSGSDDVWMLPETRRICSIYRESISAESYPTFCLKNICAKMIGHLVLETGITPGRPENMKSLRLEIRGRRHNVEISSTVPWLRRDIRKFDIWFGVSELLYLVRTASVGTTHAGENLCSQGLQGKGYLGLCNERRQLSVSAFGVREQNTDFISITTAAGESTETLRVFA